MGWQQINRRIIYESKHMKMWLDEVELPSGNVIRDYSGADLPDGVMVIATDSKNRLLIFNEYRYAVNENLILVPAGGIDEGEDPIEAAKRELLEETGYTTDDIEIVGENLPYPSKIKQRNTIVRARNIKKAAEVSHETTESIHNIRFVTSQESRKLFQQNSYKLAGVVASIAQAAPEFLFSNQD